MYRCRLNINLIRCPEEIAAVLTQDIFPLERFSHKINRVSELTTQPPTPPQDILLIVCPAKIAEGKLNRLNRLSANQRLVVLTDDQTSLSVELLRLANDVWPLTLTPELIKFYFVRWQKALKAEKDAWLKENYLNTVINMLPDLVWFKDISGCHLDVNDAFCEAVDKPKSDIRGHYHCYIWGLTEEEYQENEMVCVESEDAVIKARKTCTFEEEVMHAKRGLRQLTTWKAPVFDEGNNVLGTVGIGRDVTEERENQAKILQLAHTDPLTGLSNRRYFYDCVTEQRHNRPLTVFYIDLDHFKELNDTYGHQSGDAALLGLAELLRGTFSHDLITRLGGDEFAVARFGAFDKGKVTELLEHLRKTATEFFALDECMSNLSMSIGVATTNNPADGLDTVIMQSDAALYHSKEHGRDQYSFYDELDESERRGMI